MKTNGSLRAEDTRQKGKKVYGSEVKNVLMVRKQFLEMLIQEKTQALQNAPSGKLRIDWRNGKPQYYYRSSREMREGKYISKKQSEQARVLAQKDYDEKVLRAASRELYILDKTLERFPKKSVDEVFHLLSEYRQDMIDPIEVPDAVFVKEWSVMEYTGKGFAPDDPVLITDRGERVRSKSEMLIANLLYQEKIPYRYEFPVSLQGWGAVYPDFTVLNIRRRKELLWEHLGKMDDPIYAEYVIKKMHSYISSGYFPGENLILTAETKQRPISNKTIKIMIQRYCR